MPIHFNWMTRVCVGRQGKMPSSNTREEIKVGLTEVIITGGC